MTDKKILLIEDNRYLVDVIHDYLKSKGYSLIITQNIQDALALAEKEHPLAVLLDILIPKTEGGIVDIAAEQGYDFLKTARNTPSLKNMPIIVYTNLYTTQDRKKCGELGADAYIFKRDTSPKEVLKTIETVIANAGK